MAEYSAQNNYFKKQLEKRLGKSIVGIGQIVSEESEVAHRQQGKFTSYKEQGSGVLLNKYKVRICSATNDNDPENDFLYAFGQVPCSGLRGESLGIPRYPVNSYVTVYEDPLTELFYIDEAHPNSVVNLPKEKADPGCGAASGFVPASANFQVPENCTKFDGKGVAPGSEVPGNTVPSKADKKQNSHDESIIIPSPCIKVDLAAVNAELKGLIKTIKDLRTGILGDDSFLKTSQDFLNDVQEKVNGAQRAVSNLITWLIQEIRKEVMRKVNASVNNTIGNVYLSARYAVLEARDNALDLMSCLFLKILSNLANVIGDFINGIVDTVLNTGICVIENFLSTLVGGILAQITGAINEILGPLSDLVGSAINIADFILTFAESIIDFLSCDIEQLCPVTNEWNFLEGGVDSSEFATIDFNSVFESATAFANSAIALGKVPGSLLDNEFNIDFQEAIDAAANCLGIFQCGVPTVSFWGSGSGQGTTANAVVSAAGEILGVNIITPGKGYSTPPAVSFDDSCGSGTGAYGTAVLGDYEYTDPETGETSTETGVVAVIMGNTGYGYLPSPDGSVGGMGRVIADRCQSLIRRGDTKAWEGPFDPGTVINIRKGDTVRLAGIPEYISEENISVTTPPCPDTTPVQSLSSTYPVVVSIGDVNIDDPGFEFSEEDTITVTPDNGADITPIILEGEIVGVNISNPGIGFTSMPTLTLNSNTGYNARLTPILSFRRINEDNAFEVPVGTKVVQVIDCVGKN